MTNCPYTHCSKCGGEIDSEGWCALYCMDDEEEDALDNNPTHKSFVEE